MSDPTLTSLRGNVIEEGAITRFQAGLSGNLIRPGDPDYETARHVWNRSFDKHPGLIVRCAKAADVQRASISRATTIFLLPFAEADIASPENRRAMAAW